MPITTYRKEILFGYSSEGGWGDPMRDPRIRTISTEWSTLLDIAHPNPLFRNQTEAIQDSVANASTKELEQALSMLETASTLIIKHHDIRFDISGQAHPDYNEDYKIYRTEMSADELLETRQNILARLHENHYRNRIRLTQEDLLFIKNNLRNEVAQCQSIEAIVALYRTKIETQNFMLNYQQPLKLSTLFSSPPRGELKNLFLKLIQDQAKVINLNGGQQYEREAMQTLKRLLTQDGITQPEIRTPTEKADDLFNNAENERSNDLFPV